MKNAFKISSLNLVSCLGRDSHFANVLIISADGSHHPAQAQAAICRVPNIYMHAVELRV